MQRFIGEGLKASGPNFNVLNILRTLVEDGNTEVFIPYDYQKESNYYSADPKVHMNPKEAGKPIKVVGVVSNQERFNFSLTSVIDIFVDEVDESGNFSLVPKKVYRTYSVIRDSKLEMNYIYVKFSNEETYKDLLNAGVLRFANCDDIVTVHHTFNKDYTYKIDFKEIPVISLNWAQPSNIGLYDYIKEDYNISCILTHLRKLINDYKEEGQIAPVVEDSQFYNENITYTPNENKDKKSVSCVVYDIVGLKNNLTYDDVKARYTDLKSAMEAKKSYSKEQRNVRFISRCVVMAIEMSAKKGSYEWSELTDLPRSKTKKYQTANVTLESGEEITLRRLEYNKDV